MQRPFSKVVCIGLDGATFDVIDRLVDEGSLPTLAGLLAGGTRAALASTVPPLSAPAWVSFMTGMNPGRHGVFQFRALEQQGVGAALVGPWTYQHRTLFDHASNAGLRVVAFRVPMTYPPWPVNGLMVSGFPTPDARTTYSEPPEAGRRIGPLLKMSSVRGMVASLEDRVDNFDYYLERSTRALVELLQDDDTDLFCYVNSITDWIAHKFWRHSDPEAPGYEPYSVEGRTLLDSFYEKVDASLGTILGAAPDDALVIVLSDHGTGRRSELRFNTSAWLADLGLLVPARRGAVRRSASRLVEWANDVAPNKYWLWRHTPSFVRHPAAALRAQHERIDWAASRAYRFGLDHHVEGVNVNLAGREPNGRVPPSEYESVRDQVLRAAADLCDPATGAKLIEAAYRREELYHGEHAELAPDVVLVLDPTYEFGAGRDGQVLSRVSPARLRSSSATHRPDGILIMAGPGVGKGADLGRANLLDVPATIEWALGLEVPEEMDGQVLTDVFDGGLVEAHPIRRSAGTRADAGGVGSYSEDEEQQLATHLEELGYL